MDPTHHRTGGLLSRVPLRRPNGHCATYSTGRPRGAKNRLTARVLADMEQVWTELVSEGRPTPAESKTTGLSALLPTIPDPRVPAS
jgi:hypothetical protein